MRSKTPILLYCADAHQLSATAYALRLHPYEVSAFCNSTEVAALLADERNAGYTCGVLIHAKQGDLAPVRYADIVLYGHNTSMAHILAALEVLCERKRGPKSRSAA